MPGLAQAGCGAARRYGLTLWFLTFWSAANVREYVFYVLFRLQKKHDFYGVFEMTYQKVVKSHKKYQVCWMSIEILASKLPDVMGTYRLLSHTVFSCIVSCVCTSVQDVWCWWVVQGCTVLVLCDLAACKMSDLFMLPTKRYSVNYIWWIPRKCLDGYVWWLYRLLFCLKRTEAPLTKDPLLETWQIQA